MKSFCRLRSWGGQHGHRFQISMLILSVMFTTSFHEAAAERNTSITWFPGGPRPWNETYYKTQRNCSDFRNASGHIDLPSYFYYWPEGDREFHHCCSGQLFESYKLFENGSYDISPGMLIADNFTHGNYGPKLNYKRYYDVGLIDELCMPYWRCRNLFDKLMQNVLYSTRCERTDLLRFYQRRFWYGCVLKYGILMSALPAIVSLEMLVLLVALIRAWQQDVVGSKKKFMVDAGMMWIKAVHKTVLIVWIHLLLLAVIGNGLIEAIGRQDAYTSQSKSYYNYGHLYTWLSVLVWVSSFYQQISYWIAVVEDSEVKHRQSDDQEPDQTSCRHTSEMTKAGGEDWAECGLEVAAHCCAGGHPVLHVGVPDVHRRFELGSQWLVWGRCAGSCAVEWPICCKDHFQHLPLLGEEDVQGCDGLLIALSRVEAPTER